MTPHSPIYSGLTDTQLPYCQKAGRGLRTLFLTSSKAHCYSDKLKPGLISPTASVPKNIRRTNKSPNKHSQLKKHSWKCRSETFNKKIKKFYQHIVHHYDAPIIKQLRIKFPTRPCWLFMAWFHIHLSTPSQQMGLRIYAFLQQWCHQSGKLPLDGRRDNKKGCTPGSIAQRSLVFSQQHKGVTEIEELEPNGKRTWSCKKVL